MHWWLDADDIPACKRCCECRELQPLTHYTTQKEARDKHASRCKLCTTANSKLLRHLRLRYPRPPPGTPCAYCDQPANKHHLDHDHDLPFPECLGATHVPHVPSATGDLDHDPANTGDPTNRWPRSAWLTNGGRRCRTCGALQ